MNPTQFLYILKARLRILLLALVATVAVTIAVSLMLPKRYEATASLVLNYKGTDPVTGAAIPAQLMPGYMATQVDIIRSKGVALAVVDALKLHQAPSVQSEFAQAGGSGDIREWLAGLLQKELEVIPSRESSVVEISFTGTDPQFAATMVNTFARQYQEKSVQLKVEPMQQAAVYFTEQLKGIRENLETAQNKLSKYQQDKGIVSLDNRLDVESARLNDLSTQLVVAQGQLMEAVSRQRQAQGEGSAESPDVMNSPLIQNLKSSLAQAEAKLAEMDQRLGRNHPSYQGVAAEIEQLRTQLNQQVRSASNSVGNSAKILQRRELELRGSVEAQKTRVLELNRLRDEMSVLQRDVESAQRAYDVSMQRFNQINLEGKSNQTEVAILSEASVPRAPASPKVLLNAILSVFVGGLLGVALALLVEMLDRRVRSADDLESSEQPPLLGVLKWSDDGSAPRRPLGQLIPGRL